MLKIKTELATQKGKPLDQMIEKEIFRRQGKIAFRGLGKRRSVFLTKYLEATARQKRSSHTRRKRCFFAGLEVIQNARSGDLVMNKETQYGMSYEYHGLTPEGIVVTVHIREEMEGKDKKLFLISTFEGKKMGG